jgi:hypothetical protein
MDLTKAIEDLRREKERLDRMIAQIEQLRNAMNAPACQNTHRRRMFYGRQRAV